MIEEVTFRGEKSPPGKGKNAYTRSVSSRSTSLGIGLLGQDMGQKDRGRGALGVVGACHVHDTVELEEEILSSYPHRT